MGYKIQFREEDGKRYFDFSTRKLRSIMDAKRLKKMAEKDFPKRRFKIKKK